MINYLQQTIEEGREHCASFLEFYIYLQQRKVAMVVNSAHNAGESQHKPHIVYYYQDGVYPEQHLDESCSYSSLIAGFACKRVRKSDASRQTWETPSICIGLSG